MYPSLRSARIWDLGNSHDIFHARGHHGKLVSRRSGDNLLIKVDMPIERDVGGVHIRVIGMGGWVLGSHCRTRSFEDNPAFRCGDQVLVVVIYKCPGIGVPTPFSITSLVGGTSKDYKLTIIGISKALESDVQGEGIQVRSDLAWIATHPAPWGNFDGNEIIW